MGDKIKMNTKELETRCNELFFQVNEKTERIAELEKENAELKENCNSLQELVTYYQTNFCQE